MEREKAKELATRPLKRVAPNGSTSAKTSPAKLRRGDEFELSGDEEAQRKSSRKQAADADASGNSAQIADVLCDGTKKKLAMLKKQQVSVCMYVCVCVYIYIYIYIYI
jgi:hypothetical protein